MMAGVVARTEHNAAAARVFAQKALAREPKLALAHNAVGLTLVADGNLNGARVAFQKAAQLDPRLALAHLNLGYVNWQQKRFDDARKSYERAGSLNPESAIPHHSLSTALHSLEKFEEAEKASRTAISRYALRDDLLASFYVQFAVTLYEQSKQNPAKQEQALEAVARAKALGLAEHPAYAVIEAGATQERTRQ
jgi:superkiller protein 3